MAIVAITNPTMGLLKKGLWVAVSAGVWGGLRLCWLRFWGNLANLAAYPCVVREGRYESPALGVSVQVKASNLYTVVTVNGVELYFYRLTGGFDGVGATQSSDCRVADAPESSGDVHWKEHSSP